MTGSGCDQADGRTGRARPLPGTVRRPVLLPRLLMIMLVGALAAPGLADVVILKNGGRIEGSVKDQGDTWLVTHRFGSVTVKKSDVAAIEKKPTLEQVYGEKKKAIDERDPDALVALGKWCREQGWESRARKEFRAALTLNPDHRAAHSALGHIFFEGKWRTETEIMRMRGFVRYRGNWVTKEEVARLKAVEAREKERRTLQRKVNGWFRDIAYGTKKRCDKAYGEVVTFARKTGNKPLEKYAGDVKAWFDRYWKAVRQAQKGTFEIRATMSRLKRPIPTFRTSLGAGSTPVTLQLPELSVVSVKTTVVVPLGRGE